MPHAATDGPDTRRQLSALEMQLLRLIGSVESVTQKQLADQMGRRPSQVHRWKENLIAAGLIEHEPYRKGGLRLTPDGEKIVKKSSQPA